MDRGAQAITAERFRSLHRGPRLLLLPNAWDALSAIRELVQRLRAIGRFDAIGPRIGHPEAQTLFGPR